MCVHVSGVRVRACACCIVAGVCVCMRMCVRVRVCVRGTWAWRVPMCQCAGRGQLHANARHPQSRAEATPTHPHVPAVFVVAQASRAEEWAVIGVVLESAEEPGSEALVSLRINGRVATTAVVPAAAATGLVTGRFTLGSGAEAESSGPAARGSTGVVRIAEVAVHGGAVPEAERRRIEEHLVTKHLVHTRHTVGSRRSHTHEGTGIGTTTKTYTHTHTLTHTHAATTYTQRHGHRHNHPQPHTQKGTCIGTRQPCTTRQGRGF